MKTLILFIVSVITLSCIPKSDSEKLIGSWEVIDAYNQNNPVKKENLNGLIVSIKKDSLFLNNNKTSGCLWTLENDQLKLKNHKENIDVTVRVIKLENHILKVNVPGFGDTSVWTLKK